MLGLVPGCPKAELEAAVRDLVDRDRLGRQHRWMPIRHPTDEGAKPDSRGVRGQAGKQRPSFQTRPAGVTIQRFEVVENPGPVEPMFFCELDPPEQFRPLELVLGNV
ncbi:MAG: hypothetical protein PVSMB9_02470 [Candidatus Dormibacteria bacterium]